MKKTITLLFILLSWQGFSTETFSNYYYQKVSLFEQLPVSSEDILFVGDSITDGAEWSELFADARIKNRGISGDTVAGVAARLPSLLKSQPDRIFLMIGTNDVKFEKSDEAIASRIAAVIGTIRKESPRTVVFLQSLLPMNPSFSDHKQHVRQWRRIPRINLLLKDAAETAQIRYIDLYSAFADENGRLKEEYTNDGLHLTGNGYRLWKSLIEKYVTD